MRHAAERGIFGLLAALTLTGAAAAGPAPMSAFTPPARSEPATHFEGRLVLEGPLRARGFTVLRDQPFHIKIDAAIQSLPPFDIAFVQDGDALIPMRRGALPSAHPDWRLMLEPGRVWREAGDGGLSRAAVPFFLQERGANCLHDGVLTFAYRAGGAVTQARWQISSETCAYFKFDAWGVAKARYVPGRVDGGPAAIAGWRREVAGRLPVRPIADLIAAHPGVSAAGLALAAPSDGDPASLYGVVVDGVNYVSACETRAGPYPFCDVLDLPSYSTAKTVAAAVGLMRLEQLWPGARQALISDYVPECATPDWAGVTFENALDMTTGVYDDPGYEVDEMADDSGPFFRADRHADKIAFACGHDHRRSQPGAAWVYRTTDTYVLGAAMQAFVRRRLGSDKDLYRDLIATPLWGPLGLSPVVMDSQRTDDAVAQPFFGYGLTYHRDDVAKIARFLGVGDGEIDGEAMLDPSLLASGLQRDAAHPGMTAGYPGYRYESGLWARDLAPVLKCPSPIWTPFMSGYGGISIVMLTNGVQYYYFGDSQLWDWSPAAVEIAKIRPICP